MKHTDIDVENFDESELEGCSAEDLTSLIASLADELAHVRVSLGDAKEERDNEKYEREETRDHNAELEGDIKDVLSAARDFAGEHTACFFGCDCQKGCGVTAAFNHFTDIGYSYLVKL